MNRHFIFVLAAALAAASSPSEAWVAAGPRGVAAGGWGSGVAYGRSGGAVAWDHGVGYVHGGYYGGYSGGQVAAAAVAGVAVGAMAGAAMASSNSQSSAYQSPMPIGSQVTQLPDNCGSVTVGNVEYYQCGPNWFRPYFGNSSVYYQVVPMPY